MSSFKTSLSLASAAAVFALAAFGTATTAVAAGKSENVHCYGVNSCKGTSDCKTAQNECKGQNSCKGHGFKEMSAKECKTQGGSDTPPAK